MYMLKHLLTKKVWIVHTVMKNQHIKKKDPTVTLITRQYHQPSCQGPSACLIRENGFISCLH